MIEGSSICDGVDVPAFALKREEFEKLLMRAPSKDYKNIVEKELGNGATVRLPKFERKHDVFPTEKQRLCLHHLLWSNTI